MVGETPTLWSLRDDLASIAATSHHVLLFGPSGAGKELAARTVYALSKESRGPLIDRNAATFPAGLVDAELFGSARNYPNAGSPERDGLVGGPARSAPRHAPPADEQALALNASGPVRRLGAPSGRPLDEAACAAGVVTCRGSRV
jgi:two-component system nitrogen regulation response regulator GlnG/two-component system response regulator HydG